MGPAVEPLPHRAGRNGNTPQSSCLDNVGPYGRSLFFASLRVYQLRVGFERSLNGNAGKGDFGHLVPAQGASGSR
jgi:hypothetical protein